MTKPDYDRINKIFSKYKSLSFEPYEQPESVSPSERNSVILGSNLTQTNFL